MLENELKMESERIMKHRYECNGCNNLFNHSDIFKIHEGTGTAYRSFGVGYYCKECYYEKHVFPHVKDVK